MEKKKILVVDDEVGFGRMVKLTLEMTGQYAVVVETKGKRALSVAKKFRPDLIFLDIVMPDADGGEIKACIKSDQSLKNIPIIFLTALISKTEVGDRADSKGFHQYLAKPPTRKQLIECIEEHLGTVAQQTGT